MGKEYLWPDPNGRSANEPVVLVSPAEIRKAYRKCTKVKNASPENMTSWYAGMSVSTQGWVSATSYGLSILLSINALKE